MMQEKIKKYVFDLVLVAILFLVHYGVNAQDKNNGLASINTSANDFAYPQSIFVDSKNGHIWVTDFDNNRVLRFDVSVLTDIGKENVNQNIPAEFSLAQNFPNPFNPATTIRYQIPVVEALSAVEVHVSLKVYDVLGNEVATLVDELKPAGTYNSQFSIINSQLSSGVYFYTFKAGSSTSTKKMIIVK